MLFGGERFFYLGPSLIDPLFHFLRIALPGLPGGSLECPVHRSEDLPHMSRVIVHPGQSLDNNRYARKRPQICAKTMGPCSLSQCNLDTSQLLSSQLRFATHSARASQCAAAATLPLLVPAAYALPAYLQFSCNPRQDHLACREQSSRSLPPLPHGLEIPPLLNVSFHASHYTIKRKYCHSIMRDSVRPSILKSRSLTSLMVKVRHRSSFESLGLRL